MIKTSENWQEQFLVGKFGANLFDEFAMRAKAVSSEVFRVGTVADAADIIF